MKKKSTTDQSTSHNMATAQYPRGMDGKEVHPWGQRGNSISAHGLPVFESQNTSRYDFFLAAALTGLLAAGNKYDNALKKKAEKIAEDIIA